MDVPLSCSWIWRSILKLRSTFLPYVKINLAEGSVCNFWTVPWIGKGIVLDLLFNQQQKYQTGISCSALAVDYIADGKLVVPYSSNQVVRGFWGVYAGCCFIHPEQDNVMWNERAHAVSSVYTALIGLDAMPDCKWYKVTWSTVSTRTDNLCFWKVLNNALMTRDKLVSYGMTVQPNCELCDQHCESVDHIFFKCPYVLHVWSKLLSCMQGMTLTHSTTDQWLLIEQVLGWKDEQKVFFFYALKKFIKVVWNERNLRIFEGKRCSKDGIWLVLKREIYRGMQDSNYSFLAWQYEPWVP